MVPNIERGISFKGVADYLMHDKREGSADKGATSERVGFVKLMNFIGDEARNPFEAAKIMALTIRDADILKAEAGIKPGGRKAEKPPVWHMSLSWHPSEEVTEAEMNEAVENCLSAVGLGLDKGYHTFVVQHTDEPQPHVHVVVNLVHPVTGKQANPYRDLPKAQAWGLKYEQARGTIFCTAREAKYGEKSPKQAAFNAAARDAEPWKQDRFGRNRDRQPREPRPAKNGTGKPGEAEAADKLNAENRARFAEISKASKAAFERRREEARSFYQSRKEEREKLVRLYAEALDTVWRKRPDNTEQAREAARNAHESLSARRSVFEKRESSVFGRLTNAARLTKNGRLSAVVSLALNGKSRRRAFEQSQQALRTRMAPPPPKQRSPESKKALSDRVKAMRAADLSAFDRKTAKAAEAMKSRHNDEIESEKQARRDLAESISAAWREHAQTFEEGPKGRITDDPARVIEALTTQHSTFTRADLRRFVTRELGEGKEALAAIARVEKCPELVSLGKDDRGRERFTARDLHGIERQMMADALTLHGRNRHAVSARASAQALADTPLTLSDEQDAAFRHITGPTDLAAVIGFAGSGKSTMLGAARKAWEGQGYRVLGTALAGVAADGLTNGAGIDSRTIHSRLHAWDKGKDLLTSKDVLVVDEVGMIGSRLMARVLHHARQAGAKVVLVGDAEQLQAIEAGAAFRAIIDKIGAVEITAIHRQREEWQQTATRDFATGSTAKALHRYEAAGMVHHHADDEAAMDSVIAGWDQARTEKPDQSQIILAYTRDQVRELNERARAVRRAAEEIGPGREFETERGKREFAENDRVYFLKNDRNLGVRNGSLATIERIDGSYMTVKLDNGARVNFSMAEYSQIDHGYAATVHKSQGVTVDRTHVLASRFMDRHAVYVGMTRHRDRVDVHWSSEVFSSRADLSRSMSRRRAKDTSLDYDDQEAAPEAPERPAGASKDFGAAASAKSQKAPHGSNTGKGDGFDGSSPWTPEEMAELRKARADKDKDRDYMGPTR